MIKKNPAVKKGRPGPEVAAKGLKQVKKILRKEPFLSQQYLDIAGVILVCLSPDQSITMINRKGCELLGYAQKDLLGKNWFDVILPENERAEIKAMFARLISGELKPIEYVENHVVTRDGEKRLISWHNTLVRDEEGDITGSLSSGEDITERRQAEEAMREQETRLRGIVENSQAGYFSIDLEGRFRQVNDAWLRMHGYKSPDEVIGKHLSLTQVEADYETAQRNVKFLLAGNPIPIGESTRRRKDGSVGYHTFSANPIFRADKVIGLEGFIIDTTAIKQSQESLLHLTQLNQEVISGAQEGIVVYDLQMCYVLWNAFMETLTGVMASEILGKCALDVFPHLREQGVDRLIEGALAGEIIRSPDTPFRSPATGRSGWVVGTYAPHRNINGDIVGVIATIQDITERKQAEETLSELGVYNRSLIEASIDPLVTIDHAGKISDVNIATEQITGLSRHDLIGSDFSDYFTDPGKAREGYRQVFKRSTVRDYSLEIRHRDGHSTEVLYNASVYRDKSGQVRGVFAAARDITDRIRLEEEQQKVAKLESIGILAAGIAHNFNNILTVILGNISLAKMDAIPGSETHQILDQAEKASVKAKDLTAQLLTFSKGGAPVKKIASLTELLKDTADSALQGSNVICHFSIPADLRQAEFDEAQLRQVIYNLVLNAQQAMPKGGTIDLLAENITVGTTQDRSKDIMLKAGDYVRIAVTDHGGGIPEKNISKIFDPFFTTKIKAIGLGLATSFSIVRQHGGYIRVDSRAGAGTTVHVYLPIAKESERNPDN